MVGIIQNSFNYHVKILSDRIERLHSDWDNDLTSLCHCQVEYKAITKHWYALESKAWELPMGREKNLAIHALDALYNELLPLKEELFVLPF